MKNLKQLCDDAEYIMGVVIGEEELDISDIKLSDDELMKRWLDEYADYKRQLSLEKVGEE